MNNEHSAHETLEASSPHEQEPAANSDARVEDCRELLQQLAQSAKAQDAKLVWLECYVVGTLDKDEAIVRMQSVWTNTNAAGFTGRLSEDGARLSGTWALPEDDAQKHERSLERKED